MATFQELKRKHPTLPSYNDLNTEFDLDSIESFSVRAIVQKMIDHICWAKDILRPVLEPDPSAVTGLYEQSHVTTEEKDRLFLVFKRLSHIERNLHTASLLDDGARVRAIRNALSCWKEHQPELAALCCRLAETWLQDEVPEKKETEYLG